ncbi:hypothetical protein HKD37_11G032263 [Glycine soja]
MPQNTFTTFRKSPNSYNRAQTPSNEEVDTQFSTQIGLENITTEERGGRSTKKKKDTRVFFSIEEEKILINNYNTFCGNLSERSDNQLKSQCPKNHNVIQKFNGYYKQVVALKKSGYTENNMMINPYAIWKWLEQCAKVPSKRTKPNENWNYSSSSNPETPIDVFESDTPTPLARPMGQKAVKRKIKGKGPFPSTLVVNLSGIEKEMNERNAVASDSIVKMYEILMKDKDNMTQEQHNKHKIICDYIEKSLVLIIN